MSKAEEDMVLVQSFSGREYVDTTSHADLWRGTKV